jgi:PKD repeat protein
MQVDVVALNKQFTRTLFIDRMRSRLPGANAVGGATVTLLINPTNPSLNEPFTISGQVSADGVSLIGNRVSLIIDGQVVGYTTVTRSGYTFQHSFNQFGKHTIQVTAQFTVLRQKNSNIATVDIEPQISVSLSNSQIQVGNTEQVNIIITDDTGTPVKTQYTVTITDPNGNTFFQQTRITNPETGKDSVNFTPNITGLWNITVQVITLKQTTQVTAIPNQTTVSPPTPTPTPIPIPTPPPPTPITTGPQPTPTPTPTPTEPGQLQITSFTASPQGGNTPVTVVFNGAAIGGYQPYVKWSFDFGDGIVAEDTSVENTMAQAATIQHTYERPGTYQAVLTVEDGYFNSVSSQPITIVISEPALVVSVSADPSSGFPPLPVTLRASATGGEPSYEISWNYGDGSPPDSSQGAQAVHTYQADGTFTATANVFDANLQPGQGSAQVVVGPTTASPSDISNQINVASYQNGVINIVVESSDLTTSLDIVGYMLVQLLDSNGSLISAQQRQVTVPAGSSDTEAFLFQPPGNGEFFVVFQFWSQIPGGTQLGTSQTTDVNVQA